MTMTDVRFVSRVSRVTQSADTNYKEERRYLAYRSQVINGAGPIRSPTLCISMYLYISSRSPCRFLEYPYYRIGPTTILVPV